MRAVTLRPAPLYAQNWEADPDTSTVLRALIWVRYRMTEQVRYMFEGETTRQGAPNR